MTAFDYARSRATAERLIARFGRAVTVRRKAVSGATEAWNPSTGTVTTTDYPATAVITEYAAREIDGTLIRREDRRVQLSTEGLNITPTTADALIVGSDVLAIVNVAPLEPGGTVVLYELQVRK